MSRLRGWFRRLQIGALNRMSEAKLTARGEAMVVSAYRRAGLRLPHNRKHLSETGFRPNSVRTIEDFRTLCPLADKSTLFASVSIRDLVDRREFEQLAQIVTSSGHGSRFAFGLVSRAQARAAHDLVDLGLEYSFGLAGRRTLLVNCLPMGIRISSRTVTVAETSVREDMALAVIDALRGEFDQVILVGDPLFLKRLADEAADQRFEWRGLDLKLIVGEETFGEAWRDYLAGRFGLVGQEAQIRSSLGAGELGLNLMFESAASIGLRRRAEHDPELAKCLFGQVPAGAAPMLFVYNPLRTYIEIDGPDEATGFGALTVSLTDTKAPIPIFRYRTGDRARLVCREELARMNVDVPEPLPLIAFAGRDKDRLHCGLELLDYKEALYADVDLARKLTGAFRLRPSHIDSARLAIDLQVARKHNFDRWDKQRLQILLPGSFADDDVVVWAYENFPYGMGLDLERKFSYLAAA